MIEKRWDMVLIELVESRAARRERLGKWVAAELGASVDAAHGGNSIRGYRHKCADVGERLADEGAREVTELGDAEVESLRAQVASLTEELAELPRVRPVEGGRPGEVDVFHDGHSHHFVPSSVLTHAQGRAEKAEKERDSLMADMARSTVGDNALDRLRLKQYAEFRKQAEDRQAVLRSELTAMMCAYEGAAREMVAARERAEKAERFAKMSEGDEELLEEQAGKMNEYPKIEETIRVTLVMHCPKCSKRLDVDHVFTGEETDAAEHNILESVRNRLRNRLGGDLLRRGWTVEMCGKCRDTAAPEAP